MATSVFISDNSIRAAIGKDRGAVLQVEGCYSAELEPGIVSGGVVRKPEELNLAVAAFFSDIRLFDKAVRLAVDSAACVVRAATLPDLPGTKLRAVAENEISDGIAGMGDPVVDHMVMGKPVQGSGVRVLIAAAERENLLAFKNAVLSAGKKVKVLDIGPGCAMRLIRRIPPLLEGDYVIVALNGNDMVSTLYLDGFYGFIERVKLLERRGTPASAVEISRAIGHLTQFYASQRLGGRLSAVYICGFEGEETEYCPDMELSLGINVSELPECPGIVSRYMYDNRISYGDYLYCLGGLTDPARDGVMLEGNE